MSALNPRRPLRSPFDAIRRIDHNSDGSEFEYWSAREAMSPLGYVRWENMENVIRKARAACRNAGESIEDNFRDIRKLQSGSQVPFRDVQLTRFAMYLVAMNGDPDKPEIAAAQRYFAVQTRRAEQLLPPAQAHPTPAPTAVPPAQSRAWAERFRETFMPHVRFVRLYHSEGQFTIVTATVAEMLHLEDELLRHFMQTRAMDRPDISIGGRWGNYRRDLGLPTVATEAPLYLPNVRREVMVKVYPAAERATFEGWFNKVYLPECLFLYIDKKAEMQTYPQLSRASVADNTSRNLAGRPANLPPALTTRLRAIGGFSPAPRPLLGRGPTPALGE